uniref:Peptidase S54 rhomboid domain-containing protein n=1 Tax=Ditylenchus dipsaci TaxID=166011 RepID=A0A915DGW3_9BILA
MLHVDFLHYLTNANMLVILAKPLEKNYGRLRLLFVYVICSISCGMLRVGTRELQIIGHLRVPVPVFISGKHDDRRIFVVQSPQPLLNIAMEFPPNSSDLGQFESAPIVIAGLPKSDRLFCRSGCKSANLLNDGMVYKASGLFDTLTSPITAVSNAI